MFITGSGLGQLRAAASRCTQWPGSRKTNRTFYKIYLLHSPKIIIL